MEPLPKIQRREAEQTSGGLCRSILKTARQNAADHARDEDGALIIFGLFMFVLMLLACGMGLDLMRLEAGRIKLQSTVDRAALAAASLDQTLPPDQVVADYFAKAHLSDFLSNVVVTDEPGLRNVSVETTLNMPMHFMNLAGINTLPAPAFGAAEESIGDVEISMVLDVSGSMGSYNRLTNLKLAAEDFVDVVYGVATAGVVSTSIVPYATQVNAGRDLLARYNTGIEFHDDSHCVNFDQSVFGTMGLSTTEALEQTQHFDPWYNSQDLQLPVCRDDAGVDILAWSQDPVEIKAAVNAFQSGGNTSTDVGVKWGNALLDPGSQNVLHSMADDGHVDNSLRGRPYAFDSGESMKVMVVMSDGVHTNQYKMKPQFRGNKPTNVWADYSGGEPVVSIWSGNGQAPAPGHDWELPNPEFYYPSTGQWGTSPIGGGSAERMRYQELWANFTVRYHAYEHMEPVGGSAARNDVLDMVTQVEPTQKNSNLIQGCTAAKDSNVIIFSIGLEVTEASGDLLEACASSPNHYFLVNGQDLSYAFKSIAGQINQLRLIQ